jgi:hypothetical protein
MAKLSVVQVLPSPGCALVTSTAWGGRGAVESRMAVRRM